MYVWYCISRNIDDLNLAKVQGFILNIAVDFAFGPIHVPIQRKHWITVREVNSVYYNLDSKLKAPEKIGNESDLKTYLKGQICSKDTELFVVFDSDLHRDSLWTVKNEQVQTDSQKTTAHS